MEYALLQSICGFLYLAWLTWLGGDFVLGKPFFCACLCKGAITAHCLHILLIAAEEGRFVREAGIVRAMSSIVFMSDDADS